MELIVCHEDCTRCEFAQHLQCPPGDEPLCDMCSWAPICPCTNPKRSPRRAAQILARIRVEGIAYLPPDAIAPPAFSLRLRMDQQKLREMAESMRSEEVGMIEPLTVRPVSQNDELKIELVLGTMRLAAAKLARLSAVPCTVRRLTDAQALVLCLVENLQREDLTWAEEARALAELQRVTKWSGREIARKIGKSTRYVHERLEAHAALQGATGEGSKHKVLPPVAPYVESGPDVTPPPLRAVTAVTQVPEPAKQQALLAEVVEEGLTEEETKARVARELGVRMRRPSSPSWSRGSSRKGPAR